MLVDKGSCLRKTERRRGRGSGCMNACRMDVKHTVVGERTPKKK